MRGHHEAVRLHLLSNMRTKPTKQQQADKDAPFFDMTKLGDHDTAKLACVVGDACLLIHAVNVSSPGNTSYLMHSNALMHVSACNALTRSTVAHQTAVLW